MALTKPNSGDPGYSGATKASVLIGAMVDKLNQLPINVKEAAYGAEGDGSTDDTSAFNTAATAAGDGGTIFVPAGTFILNNWTPTQNRLKVVGVGNGQSILKAKTSATGVATIQSLYGVQFQDVKIDGRSKASHGISITTDASTASQNQTFTRVWWDNCDTAIRILNGGAVNQADKNSWYDCRITTCNLGLDNACPNGQEQWFYQSQFGTCTTAVKLSGNGGAEFGMVGGGIVTCTTAFLLDTTTARKITLINTINEGNATEIDASGTKKWPTAGVELYSATFQGTSYNIRYADTAGKLISTNGHFGGGGNIDASAGTGFRFIDLGSEFTGGSGLAGFTGTNLHVNAMGSRLFHGTQIVNNGIGNTALVNGDITTIGANFGVGATATATGTDTRFKLTVTAAGTPGANPSLTLTFHDGAWPVAPFVVATRGDQAAPTTGWWQVNSTTTTTCVLTFVGTPVAGNTYSVWGQVIG